MSLKRRVTKLESGGDNDRTVFASVPGHWSSQQAEEEVRKLAIAQGISEPFGVVPSYPEGLEAARIDWVGSMHELMEYVYAHGKRLGQSRQVVQEAKK